MSNLYEYFCILFSFLFFIMLYVVVIMTKWSSIYIADHWSAHSLYTVDKLCNVVHECHTVLRTDDCTMAVCLEHWRMLLHITYSEQTLIVLTRSYRYRGLNSLLFLSTYYLGHAVDIKLDVFYIGLEFWRYFYIFLHYLTFASPSP